jgi:hypothetical protein
LICIVARYFDFQTCIGNILHKQPRPVEVVTCVTTHQEDVHLVSVFSDVFTGFQVSGNLETWKPGNLHSSGLVLKRYVHKKTEKKKKIKKKSRGKINQSKIHVHDGRHSDLQSKR